MPTNTYEAAESKKGFFTRQPLILIGLLLSSSISLGLSIDLFATAGRNDFYSRAFTGLAITLEILKLCMIPEILKRFRNGQEGRGVGFCILYLALAAISVMGSVGAITSNIGFATQQYENATELRQVDGDLIESYRIEIAQNNDSIAFYQSIERYKNDAIPLQSRNRELREKIEKVRSRVSESETIEEQSILSLGSTIALATGVPVATAQLLAILIFAIMLEVATAYFYYRFNSAELVSEDSQQPLGKKQGYISRFADIALQRLENGSRHQNNTASEINGPASVSVTEKDAHDQEQLEHEEQPHVISSNIVEIRSEQERSAINHDDKGYQMLRAKILSGTKPSKRYCMDQFQIGSDRIGVYFEWMLEEGLIERTNTNRFKRAG